MSQNDKENYYKRTFTHKHLAHSSSIHFDAVVDIKTKEVPKAPPLLGGKCMNTMKCYEFKHYIILMIEHLHTCKFAVLKWVKICMQIYISIYKWSSGKP